jgi:phosphoribosylformylglycinamidine cyclo-ligase
MSSWTYKTAGVDIAAADAFVGRIRGLAAATARPEVLAGIGGFAGAFALPPGRFADPVFLVATDGVGTKLKVAIQARRYDTVGVDLVAMCVNDVLASGAEPLVFLDYFATGHLDVDMGEAVVRGIAEGCRQAGCALIGGETAEMPEVYAEGDFDLAGFVVAVVDRARLIDGGRIVPGDAVIGLASTGLHSNGFSLARRVFLDAAGWGLDRHVPDLGCVLGEELLRPTRIYVRSVLELRAQVDVKGIAHITGGGIPGNLPRILPPECAAILRRAAWTVPPVFALLQRLGNVADDEMARTFNLGIGLILVVPAVQAEATVAACARLGERAAVLGTIASGGPGVRWAP